MLRFDVGEDLLHYHCSVDRLTVYATLSLGLDAAASLGDDVSGRLRNQSSARDAAAAD
jgi:hypothetical protein